MLHLGRLKMVSEHKKWWPPKLSSFLLSPLVPMHGQLICIAFRLCVAKLLENNSYLKKLFPLFWTRSVWVNVKGHMGQGQLQGHNGRWAHINVKLLHSFILFRLFFFFGENGYYLIDHPTSWKVTKTFLGWMISTFTLKHVHETQTCMGMNNLDEDIIHPHSNESKKVNLRSSIMSCQK